MWSRARTAATRRWHRVPPQRTTDPPRDLGVPAPNTVRRGRVARPERRVVKLAEERASKARRQPVPRPQLRPEPAARRVVQSQSLDETAPREREEGSQRTAERLAPDVAGDVLQDRANAGAPPAGHARHR